MNAAANNYNNVLGYQPQIQGLANSYGDAIANWQKNGGDLSYFKQGWNGALGVDQNNLRKMNSQSLNPYDDEVTNNYIAASNKAARLGAGSLYDQSLQNMIGTGMANGSGHQTAAAKVGAQLAAQINADNQKTYMARQNALEQNSMAANKQLSDFYNTLSGIGIDVAKLSQEDLQILGQAYNNQADMFSKMFSDQNNALRTYGQAVEMGSDPTVTSQGHQEGTSITDSKSKSSSGGGFGGFLGSALGVMPWGSIFGGSSGTAK